MKNKNMIAELVSEIIELDRQGLFLAGQSELEARHERRLEHIRRVRTAHWRRIRPEVARLAATSPDWEKLLKKLDNPIW